MPLGKTNLGATQKAMAQDTSYDDFYEFNKTNLVRILPANDNSVPYVKVVKHWGVGPEKRVITCPRSAKSSAECWLCDLVEELATSADKVDQKMSARMRGKTQFLYNILDINDVATGPQVMRSGSTIHKKIKNLFKNSEYGDITDPEEGYNLTITKTGAGKKTEYDLEPKRNPSALPDEFLEWVEDNDLVDLHSLVKADTTERMKAAWEGVSANDDDDDDDEDEKPRARRRRDDDDEDEKPKAKKAAAAKKPAAKKPEPDEDDEDDDDEDEEPKAKAKVADAEDLAFDDDESDDDDEAEPAPKLSVGRTLGSRPRSGRGS